MMFLAQDGNDEKKGQFQLFDLNLDGKVILYEVRQFLCEDLTRQKIGEYIMIQIMSG